MRKLFCIALFLVAAALPAQALDLGDAPPAIQVETWVTGEEADPTKVDGNTFYLVEVWSVTCPPCVRSIPILNDLQKRYADKGLRIVSFTTDTLEEVKPFLEQHPMEYSSFIDKEGGSIVSYMAADNRTTIPHAFLFDKSGMLVWIGNPLDNLELRIQQVLSGELNGERAIAIRTARSDLQTALTDQNVDAMLAALKILETLEPDNSQYFRIHYAMLTEHGLGNDEDVRELYNSWFDVAQNNGESLTHLALFALEQGAPNTRDPSLAVKAAKRAYDLGGDNLLPAGLTLAETYKGLGRIDLAQKVLEDLSGKTDDPDYQGMIQGVLDLYREMVTVGKGATFP